MMEPVNRPLGRVYFALTLTIGFWASAFVCIRFSLHEFGPGPLALLRFIVASVCMLGFHTRVKKKAIPTTTMKDTVALMGIGVCGIGAYNFFLNLGEVVLSASFASFIISLLPVITIIFAIFFLSERVGWRTWIGVGVALFGMVLLGISSTDNTSFIGAIYVFIATLLGAFYTSMQKRYLRLYHPIQVTSYIIWGGTVSLIIFLPELLRELPRASIASTSAIVYMGIFPAAVAYLSWSYVIQQMPASKAVVYLYLLPIVSTVMGIIFLNEIPGQLTVIGGVIALLGAIIATKDRVSN